MYTGYNSEIKNETITSDVVLETRALTIFNRIRASGVLYYFLTFIFLACFLYIFFTEIDLPSLKDLLLISIIPSLFATLLLYFLFKRQFLIFLSLLIFLMPIFGVFFFLSVFDFESKQSGYVLMTNRINNNCLVKVMDFSKGEIPWYTKKGCEYSEDSKPAISLYVKSGGSSMRWHNSCQELYFTVADFKKEYNKLKNVNPEFSLNSSAELMSQKEISFANKIKFFQKESIPDALGFKNDIPNITFENILNICELKGVNLGGYKIF